MLKENHFVLLKLKKNSIIDNSLKDFCVELETCVLHLWKVDVYRQDLAWFKLASEEFSEALHF